MKSLPQPVDSWFYSDPGTWWKLLTVFVRGDAIVIVPFLALCVLLVLIAGKFGLVLILSFLLLRFLGEMVYWLLQQFGDKSYRPFDYGLKNLSNNSIYIIYQLTSICMASLALALLIFLF